MSYSRGERESAEDKGGEPGKHVIPVWQSVHYDHGMRQESGEMWANEHSTADQEDYHVFGKPCPCAI